MCDARHFVGRRSYLGLGNYRVGVANLGKFVLVLAAIVGLYALPNIVSDCPKGTEWSCTSRLIPADDDNALAQLVAVSLDGERAAVLSTDTDEDDAARIDLWSLDSGTLDGSVDVSLPLDAALMYFTSDGSAVVLAEERSENDELQRDVVRIELDGVAVSDASTGEVANLQAFDDSRAELIDALDGGELILATVDGDWYVDIDTTERWTARTAQFTDSRADAFIILRADSAPALPRILRKHPSRIQILDIDEEDVTMDIDLPSEIVDGQWSGDGDLLVAVDADGVLTVFTREDGS